MAEPENDTRYWSDPIRLELFLAKIQPMSPEEAAEYGFGYPPDPSRSAYYRDVIADMAKCRGFEFPRRRELNV